jgi:molybdopterin molybdotransferase
MRVVSAGDAERAIAAQLTPQPPVRIPLADAVGHILAEDVHATIPLPPWTNAGMDGYAVRAADLRGATRSAPVSLRLIGTSQAGAFPDRAVEPGEAMRIFTGAPVPSGADSVVRQEDTDRGSDIVQIVDARDAGANVRLGGADLERGAMAFAGGTEIGPRQIGLLAALAITHPMVHRAPRVGILATGDEVVSLEQVDRVLASRSLADVNGPALAALVRDAGAVPVPLGIAADTCGALRERIVSAEQIDLLITAGGVSVGDHDHVRGVMTALGVVTPFDRVRMRPGGPTTFGVFPSGLPWLALPGNPVSAMVTFELFGRPAIAIMRGSRAPARRWQRAVLAQDVRREPILDQYIRCLIEYADDGEQRAVPTGPQGSGFLTSIARADALALIPAGGGALAAGTDVQILPLR